MVDEIVTRQELIDAKRDAQDLGKAVNEKVIVSPRYGDDFKSLPMIAAESEAALNNFESTVQGKVDEWDSAINLITQESGVPALAVSSASGENQQDINDYTGAKWRNKAGGYDLNARVMLDNGDIVRSTVANNTNDPNVDMAGWVLVSRSSVATPSDLATIPEPKNGQVSHVESLQRNYTYKTNLTKPSNNVTVVGKWEMDKQDKYYASWFATPDIVIGQEQNLKVGNEYAASMNAEFVIDRVFWVSPTIPVGNNVGNSTAFLILSNSVVSFIADGQLKLIPNKLSAYQMMTAWNVENYKVYYPNLYGDKDEHDFSSGGTQEFGWGLVLYESKNGYIHKLKSFNMIGDPLYIGRSWGELTSEVPTNITVFEPNLGNSRRNGISATAWKDVHIIRPVIDGMSGTEPQSGIDVEPEQNPSTYETFPIVCSNLTIHNPTIKNCRTAIHNYYACARATLSVFFTGETKVYNCERFADLRLTRDMDGIFKINSIMLDNLTAPFIDLGWSAGGTCFLKIDNIYSPRSDTYANIALTPFSSTIKKMGNYDISISHRTRVGIVPHADFSTYELTNSIIRDGSKAQAISPNLYLATTPTRPLDWMPINKNGYLLSDVVSIMETASINMTSCRYTNNLVTGGLEVPHYISTLNWTGIIKASLPRNSAATSLVMNNIFAYGTDGVLYKNMRTTRKDSWVIIKMGPANQGYIVDMSSGWTFDTPV